jgi:hypothetical protein
LIVFCKKNIFSFLLILFVFLVKINAQEVYNISYYGISTKDLDDNMLQMAGDLFYSQLSEINDFSVEDKRTTVNSLFNPDDFNFDRDKLSFYIDISKKDLQSWLMTLHLISDEDLSITKEYFSLYKILMEPKSILEKSLKDLLKNKKVQTPIPESSPISKESISTEFLAGTWTGEPSINKVVILRGGRGFVIFNNGASMNVIINIQTKNDKQTVNIIQNSKPNASFFPELPRQLALESAKNAEPISWEFNIINKDSISGVKKTLLETNGSVETSFVNVEWKRKD